MMWPFKKREPLTPSEQEVQDMRDRLLWFLENHTSVTVYNGHYTFRQVEAAIRFFGKGCEALKEKP